MNKSAVRRALTTLKKQGIIKEVIVCAIENVQYLEIKLNYIHTELIQPKKKIKK